ncbi:hypothetical protein [Duganella radicis]|uniref:Uncharacterized protein n=1 Tax=Duganella radicis TaxID=551988 RepID=A0A6L6PL70_9BURK|nr:hypothetical protein [Duganella radicis]MTV39876.1 hypothetical protein [Duganella radicis]
MKFVLSIAAALTALPAIACSSLHQPTDAELFAKATAVFRARVTETKLAKFANPAKPSEVEEVVEARYEIREIFKGTPSSTGVVRDLPFGPGNCSLGLMAGTEYVFYPDSNGLVLIFSGSFGFLNSEGTDVKPRLEALRALASSR